MILRKWQSARLDRLMQVCGAYKFADGRLISIRPSVKGTLRYRYFDSGESRRLYPEKNGRFVSGPGFSTASPVTLVVRFSRDGLGNATHLHWEAQNEPAVTANRVGTTKPVTFSSEGVQLYGHLSLPENPGPYPAIVLVHGSGKDAATAYYFSADFYAAHGIAVLTFDKRGTGRSQGKFTMDFQQLARDVIAGVAFIQSLPEIDSQQIGLAGYSQGGWVAPLAASLSNEIRYVIVNYGMIESPAEEARQETLLLVKKRGLSDKKALQAVEAITIAAINLLASGFRDGWETFGELQTRYAKADWKKYLKGSPVRQFMQLPRWLIKLIGPILAPNGLDWQYSSETVLARLEIPMLWLLGDSDQEAPNELTIPKLQALQADGKPIELIIYEGADHGMLIFEEKEGERQYTGFAPGYFAAEVGFALRQSDHFPGAGN